MSDDQTKKYTNYDLELAEQKIIAAGGTPEYADALYSYFQGWRNFTMGQFGQQFVDAFDRIVAPLTETSTTTERILGQVVQSLDQQRDLVQQILDSQKNTEKVARQALSVAKAGTARLGKLEEGQERIEERLNRKRQELDHIQQELAELKAWKEAQEHGGHAD